MKTESKTIDLLRHGQPVGGDVLRGRTDHELSELGWSQMHEAVAEKKWDVIITSPLSRCQAFSEKLAKQLDVELIIAPDFREFDFGIWENQSMDKIYKEDFERIKPMWDDPMSFAAPEGESLLGFEKRILKAWFGCLARPEKSILVVCHGGVIRLLLKEILGLPFNNINRFDVPFAARSQVKVTGQEPYYYQLMSHG